MYDPYNALRAMAFLNSLEGRPLKIYVGAKFEDANYASHVMDQLKLLGHGITFDWTQFCMQWDRIDKSDFQAVIAYKKRAAQLDRYGVLDADLFIQLYHSQSQGAFVKLGLACAVNKPCIVVKPEGLLVKDLVFLWGDTVTVVQTLGEMYSLVQSLSKVTKGSVG